MKKKTRKHYREENGSGSWYLDKKKDLWRYSKTLVIDNEKKRVAFYGKTKEECLTKFTAFQEEAGLISYEFSIESTIPEMLETIYYIDFKKGVTHIPGYSRNVETTKRIENSPIGCVPIKDINRLQLEKYFGDISYLSQSYINKLWQAVRLAYRTADYHKIINDNPFNDPSFKKPKSSRKVKEVHAFTRVEQELFLEQLLNYKPKKGYCNYVPQFLIELALGMRMGEINALTTDDIIFNDDNSGVINVNKTIANDGKYKPFMNDTTKTKAGTRKVEFDSKIGSVIKQAIEDMYPNEYDAIFYNHRTNSLISTSQVNDSFSRFCKKAGVESNGQHMLRHTFATRCIENGVPPAVLSKWLGHEKITTTLDTYTDVLDDYQGKYSKSDYDLFDIFNTD